MKVDKATGEVLNETKVKKLLKQRDLRDIVDKREMLADLDKQAKDLKDEIVRLELIAMGVVDTGGTIEKGPLTAGINEQDGARRPKWKEEFAARLGAVEVERVIVATEPGPVIRKLVIVEGGKAR